VEEHRPETPVLALKPADHRVARADLRPLAGRVVQRQDAERLPPRGAGVAVRLDVTGDGAVASLGEAYSGVVGHVVGDEREAHLVPGQRERCVRRDGEFHGTGITRGSDIRRE
jgi:hypothetical protein